MKQHLTTNLADFAQIVDGIAATAQDFVATTNAMRTDSSEDGTMLTLDGVRSDQPAAYPINDYAHTQIAARLGIPLQYYRRMQKDAPALLDANIDRWFNQPVERRLVRTLNGEVRAFLSDRYQRIDNIDIMRAISPVLAEIGKAHPELRVESAGITDKKMYLKVVVPTIQYELQSRNVGDIVQAGFVISNSEVGAGMFSVDQMLFRLICKNGMIGGERFARRHLGSRIDTEGTDEGVWSERTQRLDDRTIMSAAADMVRAAVDETRFLALAAQMDKAVKTAPMVQPLKTVEVLAKKHGLTEDESTSVFTHLVRDAEGNGLGLFGLLNAVTRSAQDVESYERATELEALGGTLLDTTPIEWESLALVGARQ